eukprot:52291_1
MFQIKNCQHTVTGIHRFYCLILLLLSLYLVIIIFDSSIFDFPSSNDIQLSFFNGTELDDFKNPYDVSLSQSNASKPIPMYGEDQYCNPIQKQLHNYSYKTAVIMGLYNTGTNVIFDLLSSNCWGLNTRSNFHRHVHSRREFAHTIKPEMQSQFRRFYFKSIWNISKHQSSPSAQFFNDTAIDYHGAFTHEQLHIVMIKDPLTWIKSICKQSYYILPVRDKWYYHELCPYNISANNGTASANEWHTTLYTSLVDTWNKYYASWMGSNETPLHTGTPRVIAKSERFKAHALRKFGRLFMSRVSRITAFQKLYQYLLEGRDHDTLNETEIGLLKEVEQLESNVHTPALVVRYEDVLFHPDQVVNRICQCVKGYRADTTLIKETASKPHGKSRNRNEALIVYSNERHRYENYGQHDLEFIQQHVNTTIMDVFGYKIDTDVEEVRVPHPKKKGRRYYSFK